MFLPHPVHAIRRLEQQHKEILAETAQERRVRLAVPSCGAKLSLQRTDFMAITLTDAQAFLIAAAMAALDPVASIALAAMK